MTLTELKALKEGARVRYLRTVTTHATGTGLVAAADKESVLVYWPDDTSTLIWFAHCRDGRDTRYTLLESVGG